MIRLLRAVGAGAWGLNAHELPCESRARVQAGLPTCIEGPCRMVGIERTEHPMFRTRSQSEAEYHRPEIVIRGSWRQEKS